MRATIMLLTPSVLESFTPEQVPTLKTIILGGEAVHVRYLMPWWGRVKVITAYGSSECTSIIAANLDSSTLQEATQIGKGIWGVSWIVDPDDHDHLMSPGCTGELLLEGPIVGQGYFNDSEQTSSVFINEPLWLRQGALGHPGRHGRLYKTGDLVRYSKDGKLIFVVRKDAQVKIRGQRVELGEIEYQVQQLMPEAQRVVAEVIISQGNKWSPMLVLFIQRSSNSATIKSETKPDAANVWPIPAAVEDKLSEDLPSYMIPTVSFYMRELPMTATGRIYRRRLREIGGRFSTEQLANIRTKGQGMKREPTSKVEYKLQEIWSQVLKIDPFVIGLDDSFYGLGGGSITTMKVVSIARSSLMNIKVANVLQEKTIYKLGKLLETSALLMHMKLSSSLSTISGPLSTMTFFKMFGRPLLFSLASNPMISKISFPALRFNKAS